MRSPNLFTDSVDIFVSIHPQYAEKILDGVKTIELRRRFPSLNGFSGRLLIYSTTPVKSVIGYAEIECVHHLLVNELWIKFHNDSHIKEGDFIEYFTGATHGYAVQLINPTRFYKPLSIEYIKKNYGIIAPQSYRYLSEEHEALFSYEKSEYKDVAGH